MTYPSHRLSKESSPLSTPKGCHRNIFSEGKKEKKKAAESFTEAMGNAAQEDEKKPFRLSITQPLDRAKEVKEGMLHVRRPASS